MWSLGWDPTPGGLCPRGGTLDPGGPEGEPRAHGRGEKRREERKLRLCCHKPGNASEKLEGRAEPPLEVSESEALSAP